MGWKDIVLPPWKKEIEKIPNNDAFKNCGSEKTERRPIEKCANVLCSNIETFIGEFLVCSNCKIAHYCSRKCQKVDWKRRHKKACKKTKNGRFLVFVNTLQNISKLSYLYTLYLFTLT